MYLSELKIWNFRRYGVKTHPETNSPGLLLRLNSGFNLIVGENDSGKTAIMDAIRLVLQTHSSEYFRLELDDFHLPIGANESERAVELKIECLFRGFEVTEASHFLEWIAFEKDEKGIEQFVLRAFLKAKREGNRVYYDIKAGNSEEGSLMDARARDFLRITYLKPLRDAALELAPRKNSRLSQILDSHEAFKDKDNHQLLEVIQKANKSIENYFKGCNEEGKQIDDQQGKVLRSEINTYLEAFSSSREAEPLSSSFTIAEMKLRAILERLSLDLALTNPGLGSNNLLFIAAELTLLKRADYTGLKLVLIEEAEAHLHPQAQLRLIDYLEEEAKTSKIQLILTTHSPNLASKVSLKNLILCKSGNIFPLGSAYTRLEIGDYAFLQRFLDVTKANLFFAQGIIFVEGDAENLLLPTIAELIDIPLSKYGVSIVNVGSTAFLRYARIFQRADTTELFPVPVSCVTDCDVKPHKLRTYKKGEEKTEQDISDERVEKLKRKSEMYSGQLVKTYVSPIWTLEYDICLSPSFRRDFYKAVLSAKYLENSNKYGVTAEKDVKIKEKVNADFGSWEKDKLTDEDIAINIYYKMMLVEDISKAIVAQYFAEILRAPSNAGEEQGKDEVSKKELILKDKYLAYLVDAIKYAAGMG